MKGIYDIRIVVTDLEREDALQVRRHVFIDEQHVAEELEIDEYDDPSAETVHFVAYKDKQPVAASRLRTYHSAEVGKVERVAVLASERGTGLGRNLMILMEKTAQTNGFTLLKLSAQTQAQVFYEKLGYVPVGDEFEEADIPHIAMEKPI